tara:strand:+ start:9 stop:263 length:255 start_codon:yes stop_codon:yes gene_type:complete
LLYVEFAAIRSARLSVASLGQLKPAGITMPTDTGDDGLGQIGQRLDGPGLEMGLRRPLALLNVFEVVGPTEKDLPAPFKMMQAT